MSPGGDMYPSPGALPTMIRFSNISPGVCDCMLPMVSGSRPSMPILKSTAPLMPNDMIDFPVFASSCCNRLFIGKMRR